MEDKIKYEAPQIEYIEFDTTEDIIAASDNESNDDPINIGADDTF